MTQQIWRVTVAFSGSREPTGWMQSHAAQIVDALDSATRVVVGGCVGIDALIARLAYKRGLWVHAVLPADRRFVDPDWRDYCDSYEELEPSREPFRARNTRMVELIDRGGCLHALPQFHEQHDDSKRSGTWMTIRLARGAKKPTRVYLEKR